VKTRVQIAGIAAASLLIIFNAGEAKADLIGSSVDVTANFPSAMTIFADGGVKVVGSGVEYAVGSFAAYNPDFSIDLSGSQIIISNATGTTFSTAGFNGFVITDLSGAFQSVSANTALSNFLPVNLSVSGNEIFVNYSGLVTPGQAVSVIDFTLARPSPAPQSAQAHRASLSLHSSSVGS